ncbi:MAG: galactokinase [Victivallales bacterium]|nr:galactokinase [bacterium]MDY5696362.1 galactokinase [Victivallales bacterium]
MKQDVIDSFAAAYSAKPAAYSRAPGRLEILGNHTDYNEGFVLSCATGQATEMAIAAIPGRICKLQNPPLKGEFTIDLDDMDTPRPKDWTNYIKGVLVELRRRGISYPAFEVLFKSSVPLSAGMSSSAALEMAFCMALKQLAGIDLPLPEWARVGQSVENVYLGLKSGLLDQFSSLYGKKDSFILCDFRSVEVLKTVTMPSGWKIVVANTMVKHNLVESDYNQRRESCERATKVIQGKFPQVKTLRDVSSAMLEECKSILDHTDYLRAKHVVGEDERVMKGVELLEAGKVEEFGALWFQSHESSRDCFENSCPELDVLVELAHTIPGCVGARLSGGGFGGISIHLVRESEAQNYCERLAAAYKLKTGKTIETVICSIGDGASAESL